MKIKIYCIGKIKEPFLQDGISEYLKRLQPYAKTEVVEVNDCKVSDKPKEAEISKVKSEECDKVLKLVKPGEFLIGLDLNRKEFTSEEFADFISKKMVEGGSNISFVIGGSYGLSDALKQRCNSFVTLSKMTFLHQMTRLILLEQIYRAFKILNHEVYHK